MELTATQVPFGQLVATTIMMVPMISVIDRPWRLPVPGLAVMVSILALAIVSTALAYWFFSASTHLPER
ncbi:hypothetical protein P775_21020 [Puniceibacterium antarcticum]|uniref:Uncharacterized protein n=1 Tax=Puniceibacterium antarcticum TaxID=1206336 RepID=A0A2G8R9H8_9RHOB|nr:hypothetical protein [Puniceibacterium antarcticum]PIL18182.1 hypothetical protein P775_21020 [Puniceibacterium antarcticum]